MSLSDMSKFYRHMKAHGGDNFVYVGRLIRQSTALDAEIGKRMRRIRCGLGLTQRDLAKEMYVSVSTVCKLEHGRIRFSCEHIERAAWALGISASLLKNGFDLVPAMRIERG